MLGGCHCSPRYLGPSQALATLSGIGDPSRYRDSPDSRAPPAMGAGQSMRGRGLSGRGRGCHVPFLPAASFALLCRGRHFES